jgi:tetratricopeptide (TPR) repeat protein
VSDRDPEVRIRDLKKRVEQEPGSRYFVPLAEEYRKAGRLSDSLKTLEAGIVAHPGYVAARIALARAYLEAGRTQESIEAFSQALVDDPSNLVAAKALGDLYLSRGEPVEALKRYLRYRGISGDPRFDDVIHKLQGEVAPPPPPPPRWKVPPLPPPPTFRPTPAATERPPLPAALVRPYGAEAKAESAPPPRETADGDISGIKFDRAALAQAPPEASADDSLVVPSRDRSLDSLDAPARTDDEIVTRKIRLPQATWPFEPAAGASPAGPVTPPAPSAPPAAAEPRGRALADLYFEQGHYDEARLLFDELLASSPGDETLRRRRDEATRRAAAAPLVAPPADASRERRLLRVRLLNEWLATVRANAGSAPDRHPE